LLIVKVTPGLMVNAVYSLPVMVSESRATPVVVSTGPSRALVRPAGKVTSAPAKAVSIGAVHAPPLQVQFPVALQF